MMDIRGARVSGLSAPVRRTMDIMHVGGLKAAAAGDGLISAAAQSAGLTVDGF